MGKFICIDRSKQNMEKYWNLCANFAKIVSWNNVNNQFPAICVSKFKFWTTNNLNSIGGTYSMLRQGMGPDQKCHGGQLVIDSELNCNLDIVKLCKFQNY